MLTKEDAVKLQHLEDRANNAIMLWDRGILQMAMPTDNDAARFITKMILPEALDEDARDE